MKVRSAHPQDETAVLTLGFDGINLNENDHTWIIEDNQIRGVLSVTAVPGLPDVFELAGGVHPDCRRRGVGTMLWTAVRSQLSALGIQQLSHPVTDLASPAAQFLQHHNFSPEHEEWLLRLPNLPTRQPANLPTHAHSLQIHPLIPATEGRPPLHSFLTLYNQSFGGTPWYQPYTLEEAAEMLNDPADILFLYKNDRAIGFAWLQGEKIEPMGIVKGERGRGYGRFLLQSALHELKSRGRKYAEIGVWRENETAVRLYLSLGFQHQQTITYLACNLSKEPAPAPQS